MSDDRKSKVYAIDRGTVIDHIPTPMAIKVVEILGVQQQGILTIGINFPSNKLGHKDIVKVEHLILTAETTDRLALVAPTATINIIDNGKVVEKRPIHIPREFSEARNVEEIKTKLQVLYVTRIQKERFVDFQEYERVSSTYRIDRETLQVLGTDVRVMHPLPRVDEIAEELDNTPNAMYFRQAHNGIPTRQAVLGLVTGAIQ